MSLKKRAKQERGSYIRNYYGRYMFYFSTPTEARIYKAFRKAIKGVCHAKADLVKHMHDVAIKAGTLSEPVQLVLFEDVPATYKSKKSQTK